MKNYFSICIGFIIWLQLICNVTYAQTDWVKADNNPVIKRDTVISRFPNDLIVISDCWVIKEDSTYKMWYTAGGFNYPKDTLLRSRIGYATSKDGLKWEKYAHNPVLDVSYNGLWDSLGVETISVIKDVEAPVNQRYKMWYAGQYYNTYRYEIGYAFSADGMNWTKHNSPVLRVGSESEWDNGFLEGPSVIKEGKTYKMWYCGYDASVDGNVTDGHANIGLATSTDGINWTKHTNNPVFTTGTDTWDSHYVQDPHVINDNGIYYMWYGGNDVEGYGQQVGLATSNDGITWKKSDMNPVLKKGGLGDWDANTASFPSIIKNQDNYEMWYTGKDIAEILPNQLNYFWEIGHASSTITNNDKLPNLSNNTITISPNPVKNKLHILIKKEVSKATLTIYNQMGKIVVKKSDINDKSLYIDTSRFTEGTYSLVLSYTNSENTVKFIKIN